MAKIYPFSALRPDTYYADQLVFAAADRVVVMGGGKTEEKLPPLKTTLETVARVRPESTGGQLAAYELINERTDELLSSGHLIKEHEDSLYVYEGEQRGKFQTGIWALTSLYDDIKIHELTLADSVRRLKNYREYTGLEGSPVLLTYKPSEAINRLIHEAKAGNRQQIICGDGSNIHRLWKITDPEMLAAFALAFDAIGAVYMADGHHRLGSARKLLMEQKAKGEPVFETISALYIAADQLCIREYDRIFLPEKPFKTEWLLKELTKNFYLMESTSNRRVRPAERHRMGMLIGGTWYHLKPRFPGHQADAAILQEQVLKPLLGVGDPETDVRLKCVGGATAMEEIIETAMLHPTAIAFTLCPLTVEQLMHTADAGAVLPPKATWTDPKIPYGLMMYKHLLKETNPISDHGK